MALRYSTIIALAVAGSVNANALQPRADCPGVNYAAETNGVSTSACCVGGAVPSVFLSVCEGWPICQGPTTTTTTSTPLSCVTLLPFSDANYAADLSSITASMAASGTTYCTTIGVAGNKCNAAQTATSTGSSSNGKTSTSSTSASSTSASSATATASSNSGNTNANGVGGDASGNGGSDTTSGNGANASFSLSASAPSATTVTSEGGSGGSSSSSTTTTTTTKSGSASAFGLGWQSWALGLFGVGPAVLAILL